MTPESFSHLCNGIFKIGALLGLLASGGWAIHEYKDAKEAERIERSLRYVNSIKTADVVASVDFISQFWRAYDWEANRKKDKMQEIVRIVREEPGYQKNLVIILNYLDEIVSCIEHNICHEQIVLNSKISMFRQAVVNHIAWIYFRRKETGHVAYYAHLECFVRRSKPNWLEGAPLDCSGFKTSGAN